MKKSNINKFSSNVDVAPTTAGSKDLFSVAVNVDVSPKNWVLLAVALSTPVILFFVFKLLTKQR